MPRTDGRVAGEGRTVLFVSHNLTAVQNSAALDAAGEGPTGDAEHYRRRDLRLRTGRPHRGGHALHARDDREGNGRFRFTGIAFEDSHGLTVDVAVTGEDLEIVLNYESANGQPIRSANFAVGVYTVLGDAGSPATERRRGQPPDDDPAKRIDPLQGAEAPRCRPVTTS